MPHQEQSLDNLHVWDYNLCCSSTRQTTVRSGAGIALLGKGHALKSVVCLGTCNMQSTEYKCKYPLTHGLVESAHTQNRDTYLLVIMVTIHCSNNISVEDGMLATSGD